VRELGELTETVDTGQEQASVKGAGDDRGVVDHRHDRTAADVFDVSCVKRPARLVDDDHTVEEGVRVGAQGPDAEVVRSSQHNDPQWP